MGCQIQTMGQKAELVLIDAPAPGLKIDTIDKHIDIFLKKFDMDQKQVAHVIQSHLLALENYKPTQNIMVNSYMFRHWVLKARMTD
ncbi:MAG: hypothetical protein OMM_10699 [Candidatus Magnetoglobus multicellularis str. Araruama]|uniref:Uncharacterized protein n=1 Tax=Candidatus Magnetoglobus multicellularis str. Araruama TaxID=890399 RepID=A0A1V1P0H3_9BACT|nr:MAG: hypothetical protein OMM_10699 [Candidatus Magnetoglobus multicellularis str. Araruama]